MAFLRGCSGLVLLAAARGLSAADPAMDAASLVQARVKPVGVKRGGRQMKELQVLQQTVIASTAPENSSRGVPSNSTADEEMSLYKSWADAAARDTAGSFAGLRGIFTQYRASLIIANVFTHFDANGDGSLDNEELRAVLTYTGGSWDDYRMKKLVQALDHVVKDGLVQPSEFFFWFTWPQMDQSMDFDVKLKEMKATAIEEKRSHKKVEMPRRSAEETDIPLLTSSDIPADRTVVTKLFGRFTQLQEAVRILFFYKTFDANADHKIDGAEMAEMMDFLEPADWTRPEVDSLVDALDLITQDKSVELNEFFYWFTPTFVTGYEPKIHTSHLKKQAEKAKAKEAYDKLPQVQ